MLDRPAAGMAAAEPLLTFDEAGRQAAGGGPIMDLHRWVENYLMRAHPDLGRPGAVCPFTKQAGKLDTIRMTICEAAPNDEEAAFRMIRAGFAELEQIPAKPGMEHFRTVIIGFPHCAEPDGIAMLKRVQKRHKFYSLARFRMIGFMYATSEDQGLWNPDFRPLRAPLPVLAIRHLVEQDAPFAANHPLLMIPYLLRFQIDGAKRILAYRRSG